MSIAGNLSILQNALGQVSVTNTNPSTSTTTGALTVVGGVGIGGSLNVGGTVTATNFVLNGYQVSTSSALTVQLNGASLGTAGTLNFATGTTATLVGNVLTIQATATAGGGGGSLSGSTSTISWIMDGGGNIILTGDKSVIQVPFSCYVTQATVIGNNTGSALIYVSTASVSTWPSRTLISGSTINLSNAQTLQISTGSWSNTVLNAGSLILASLQTVSTFTFLSLSLSVIRY